MADTSDVEAAIAAQIVSVIAAHGYLGSTPVNVQRGWPTEADVRSAVSQGIVMIRVHAIGGMSRDMTRFPRDWYEPGSAAVTLTASLSGTVITFGGTPAAGQQVGIVCQGAGYTYSVTSTDTLTTIASALAAAIPGATSSGAVLTLPGTGNPPTVSVGQSGTAQVETWRAQQVFVVPVWAPTAALRDALFEAILPAVSLTYRMTLPDGTIATLMEAQASGPDDRPSRAQEWRRDLRLSYDWPVISAQTVPEVAVTVLPVTPTNGITITEYSA